VEPSASLKILNQVPEKLTPLVIHHALATKSLPVYDDCVDMPSNPGDKEPVLNISPILRARLRAQIPDFGAVAGLPVVGAG
jgi:hypothetical protein